MKEFIDFNDTSIPLGKRKVQYVKWLMHKFKYSLRQAQLLCFRKFYGEIARYPKGLHSKPMHYLLVWNKHGVVEPLNCSQTTTATDEVLAEVHKDEYYDYCKRLQGVKTKEDAMAIIASMPEHDYEADEEAKWNFYRHLKARGSLTKEFVDMQVQFETCGGKYEPSESTRIMLAVYSED